MSEEFVNNLMEFSNKIPSVKGEGIVFLTFSIIHEKGKPGQRNVLVARYKTLNTKIEIYLQSPKAIALHGVDEKELLSANINGKKFYTNYTPDLKNFVSNDGNFYTIINGDEILTILTTDKNFLKLVEPQKPVKFQYDILSYAKKFIKDIDGFALRMVSWNKDGMMDRSRLIFSSADIQTEIAVDVFKADKNEIETLYGNIKNKNKLNEMLYTVKLKEEDVVFCRLDDKRILAAKCTKGNKELLPKLAQQVADVIK